MRKKKIFLGGYINHINAQNINCKSIAKHLDKEKYIIKTLVLGSENIPSISRVSYIRVSTFLYSVSNLIAFLRAVLWADVCYVPKHQSTPKIALKIASLVRTKLFTTIEGNMCDTSKRNMINSFGSLDKMKRYFSLIPNVFGITNYIVENATCGINFQKESLSLGVEKNMFHHEIKRESLRNIIFIGSLVKTKDINEFIELAVSFPEITFNVVGSGPEKEFLKNASGSNVVFHNRLNHQELSVFLRNMDLHFLPSKSEGFPKVVLETASSSVPSIVYDSYGASEWISDYNNGFIVSDFSQVKSLVSELKENPKILEDCSVKVSELAERFDWKKVINQWEEVIEELK